MRKGLTIKSRSLGGSSDLTLLAPIKPGFVESLETVSYKTRIKRTLEILHGARMASHEYAPARMLSDAVERVGVIHSVRVAVLEPEGKVLLAVTFDGSWESYIRILWDKVGSLLDLIFCGTVGYVTSHDHPFEAWLGWARRVQVETGFYYGPPDITARDAVFYRRLERMRQRNAGGEAHELLAVVPTAEESARTAYGGFPDDPPPPPLSEFTQARTVAESARYGLQALGGLYRLTELFRPGTPDGDVLRLASLGLLSEFVHLCDRTLTPEDIREARKRFAKPLDWLFPRQRFDVAPVRPMPDFDQVPDGALADIQGGMLGNYEGATHGLLIMLAFDDRAAFQFFLRTAMPGLTTAAASHHAAAGLVFRNLALTTEGLRAAGLDDQALELFPEDFRQGMGERAGLLGDVRINHPRRWKLMNRFAGVDGAPQAALVPLESIHAVVQLRTRADGEVPDGAAYWDAAHPLRAELEKLARQAAAGVRILAVQGMESRLREVNGTLAGVDHFGYADGISQPVLQPGDGSVNRAHVGEVVVGYSNRSDAAPQGQCPMSPAGQRLQWLRNGSFLVVRKYRQDVPQFEQAIAAAAKEMAQATGRPPAGCEEEIYAKLMGRYRDGRPVAAAGEGAGANDFTYEDDPRGELCPLHAHIRRANPRSDAGVPVRRPRLMRRSMSYGPRSPADAAAQRGLVFMAYNASLSEQFEVIQQWLTGGNSSGSSSGQGCPIVGVPENGQPRTFRFVYESPGGQRVLNVELDPQPHAFEEPRTVTRLEWGLYLFVPALSVLGRLARRGESAPARTVPWSLERGRQILARLREVEGASGGQAALDAWKHAIEDPDSIDSLDGAALWAAIRADHGGVLRSPYGVIVADRDLVGRVYADRERYSVSGQRERMKQSLGEIYLGKDWHRDDGDEYPREAGPVNGAIAKLDTERAFGVALRAASAKFDTIVSDVLRQARDAGATRFETTLDAREILDEVLADLTEDWFGIGAPWFERGGADLQWQEGGPPLYPGHFTALSRYMFQPNPGPVPVELGRRYGQALQAAMRAFVQAHRVGATLPAGKDGSPAPITAAALGHPTHGRQDDFVASTLVGVIMGFSPTIVGAVLNVLNEWKRTGVYAKLRARFGGQPVESLAQAYRLLHADMAEAARMRPAPPLGWRTVREPHRLGDGPGALDLRAGDKVVLAMVAGTQQSLEDGLPDGRLMFGGVREQANHPTHACPGYDQAIAAMLGVLAVLVTRPEDVRHGSTPHSFEVRGTTGVVLQDTQAV